MTPVERRQLGALVRIELRKMLLSGRAVPLHLLAAFPVALGLINLLVQALVVRPETAATPAEVALLFASIYQMILRAVVFFGCVWVFMNLFRGEVIDRSLHFYFLAPLRREMLAAGKYLTAWIATSFVLAGSTLVTLVLLFGMTGSATAADYLTSGPGLFQAVSYAGITALACLGYGAVFLLVGLVFRNPVIPALSIFLWEGLNPLLPALLKKFSVIFYLNSMLPVRAAEGPFALLADPVPAWLAVPGLLLFTLATLAVAGWRVRRMEIAYATD